MVSVPTLMLVALCAYIGVYVLFYKKLVPVSWWLPLSKCYFYPMMLPSYLWRLFVVKGTYFSDVDSKVLLGAVPLVFAGHVDELHQRGVRTVIVSHMPQRIHAHVVLLSSLNFPFASKLNRTCKLNMKGL